MTIQDLGSIGEIVAALATVATLIYLAVQIRQNTRSLRKWFASQELRDWWSTRNPGYGHLLDSLIEIQQGDPADAKRPD